MLLLVFLCYRRQPRSAVDVRRGVPASTLTFVVEPPSSDGDWPIRVLSVVQRPAGEGVTHGSGRVMWATAHTTNAPWLRPPATIPYGARVPGYVAAQASRLPIGRYEVLVQMGDTVVRSAFSINELRRIE